MTKTILLSTFTMVGTGLGTADSEIHTNISRNNRDGQELTPKCRTTTVDAHHRLRTSPGGLPSFAVARHVGEIRVGIMVGRGRCMQA
ncbi:hypothetical protein FA15DRAFT_672904 [Coprinopsis marcescibilis]|uniref:Secreted protein n=1 Tax=Coprinopsis marcescibilis TaxID=230819 RepID=A0A5C3KYV7_COPMA|nr:hypothetical protein FA15DRAFT_672904 [Coprinopsis marcescibilis]